MDVKHSPHVMITSSLLVDLISRHLSNMYLLWMNQETISKAKDVLVHLSYKNNSLEDNSVVHSCSDSIWVGDQDDKPEPKGKSENLQLKWLFLRLHDNAWDTQPLQKALYELWIYWGIQARAITITRPVCKKSNEADSLLSKNSCPPL